MLLFLQTSHRHYRTNQFFCCMQSLQTKIKDNHIRVRQWNQGFYSSSCISKIMLGILCTAHLLVYLFSSAWFVYIDHYCHMSLDSTTATFPDKNISKCSLLIPCHLFLIIPLLDGHELMRILLYLSLIYRFYTEYAVLFFHHNIFLQVQSQQCTVS